MKSSRILAGVAAATMAIAPIAAQAGTRAADTGAVSVQPVKMSTLTRSAKPADRKSEAGGSAVIIAVLAAAAVVASDGVVLSASVALKVAALARLSAGVTAAA